MRGRTSGLTQEWELLCRKEEELKNTSDIIKKKREGELL